MTYFYYRYRLYEEATFPWKTWENLWAFTAALSAFIMFCSLPGYTTACDSEERLCEIGVLPYLLAVNALVTFSFSTFLCTPAALRWRPMRLFYLHLCHALWMGDAKALRSQGITGIGRNGLLLHLGASSVLRHGYATRAQLDGALSFAIVRNPYSRMVSLYLYNGWGRCESFATFVRRWHAEHTRLRNEQRRRTAGAGGAQQPKPPAAAGIMAGDGYKPLREEGKEGEAAPAHAAQQAGALAKGTEGEAALRPPLLWPPREPGRPYEWDLYCHVPAEVEFTHEWVPEPKDAEAGARGAGRWQQLVAHIVKQEDLYSLRPGVQPAEALLALPQPLRAALRRMPQANARPCTMPWPEYYTHEEQRLVLDMYAEDFALLGYPREMPSRLDLGLPAALEDATGALDATDEDAADEAMKRASYVGRR